MPLWDSVQRGLEKASQEAARIARTQRLRSNIDGLSRQMYAQNNAIFNKTMELFVSGQLTQSELLPLCQEMINLQQQLNQAQNELKQLQAQSSQPPAPHAADIPDVPPPPPGVEPLTVSSIETIQMSKEASQMAETRLCSICQAKLLPNHAFCQNCGAPVATAELPTMRASYAPAPFDVSTQEAMRASTPNYPSTAPRGKDNAHIVQSSIDKTSSQEADHNEEV